jgi:plastocyanin
MAHPTRHLLLWLGLIVVLIGFVYALFLWMGAPTIQPLPAQQTKVTFPADAPAPRPQDAAAAQHGFNYLVQYTASGFHPSSLSVKKGETVRITDSAAGPLTLSYSGETLATLSHMQYFEHTFASAGTYTYSSGTHSITVTIK